MPSKAGCLENHGLAPLANLMFSVLLTVAIKFLLEEVDHSATWWNDAESTSAANVCITNGI